MQRLGAVWFLGLAVVLMGTCAACGGRAPRVPSAFIAATPTPVHPTATTAPSLVPAATPTAATATGIARPTATPQPPATETVMKMDPIILTIVYDNYAYNPQLKTAWGFACLVETGEMTVLFDTGGDGPTLLGNMAALDIDPHQIDVIVLSHNHTDHTGGLDALLDADNRKVVYAPRSFPADFKLRTSQRADVIEISESSKIARHIRTTGEMGQSIIEQALLIETNEGLIVLTGCAHPGIVEIVRQAKDYGEVYMAMGGFHLKDKSAGEVDKIIAELKQLGVRQVAPSHCTGDKAIQQFKAAFGADFIPSGAGAVIRAAH